LFRLDAERAHELGIFGLRLLALAGPLRRRLLRKRCDTPLLERAALGARFSNPVGLAAGFDKNAVTLRALPALGFGFAEVGTVTPLAQAGNPRPRLHRYPEALSLQNRLGFNNRGAAALGQRLREWRRHPPEVPFPVGVNIGKNRDTPAERAAEDYLRVIETLGELADYYVLNVSSPNTPGLRALQSGPFLERVLSAGRRLTRRPFLIKVDPDLEPDPLCEVARAALAAGAAGIVATNTTLDHGLLVGAAARGGGLSGAVLRERSRRALETLRRCVPDATLVSVGGIDGAEEAHRRFHQGASLVQVYTAWVYAGPGFVLNMVRDLAFALERDQDGGRGQPAAEAGWPRPTATAGGRKSP
jgi:dihydroorotate dehydrogenase